MNKKIPTTTERTFEDLLNDAHSVRASKLSEIRDAFQRGKLNDELGQQFTARGVICRGPQRVTLGDGTIVETH